MRGHNVLFNAEIKFSLNDFCNLFISRALSQHQDHIGMGTLIGIKSHPKEWWNGDLNLKSPDW